MYIFSSSVNSDYLIPIINCQEKTRKIVFSLHRVQDEL